jgi:hypothetical protein
VFQGAAADGAILALWNVWRAGYKIVAFVHDQLVVESPADDKVKDRVADVERLMKEGMAQVVPGMLVKVETVLTASLNKTDLDPRYDPQTKELIRRGFAGCPGRRCRDPPATCPPLSRGPPRSNDNAATRPRHGLQGRATAEPNEEILQG